MTMQIASPFSGLEAVVTENEPLAPHTRRLAAERVLGDEQVSGAVMSQVGCRSEESHGVDDARDRVHAADPALSPCHDENVVSVAHGDA